VSEKARLAGLPMYDTPVLGPATDALWTATREALIAKGIAGVPERLSRDVAPEALWTDPGLLLSQACGLPLVTLLGGRVRYVATSIYAARGCSGHDYRSWLVVRDDRPATVIEDLRGSIAAVNAPHSQSGANALLDLTTTVAGGRPFFTDILVTGAHVASIEAVRSGRAACATIDCVTWHHLARQAKAGLRILAASRTAPALPYITSQQTDDVTLAALRRAMAEAITAAPEACRALALTGIAADEAAYARIRAMLAYGLRHGCARLATMMRDLP
jgi:ABC-type phosphate/phosphonate transport system substrate-binding protein